MLLILVWSDFEITVFACIDDNKRFIKVTFLKREFHRIKLNEISKNIIF